MLGTLLTPLHALARARERLKSQSLLSQFAVLSLVATVLVYIGACIFANRTIETRVLEQNADVTARVTRAVIGAGLESVLRAQQPSATDWAALDTTVRKYILNESVIDLDLLSPQGQVVYSTVGQRVGTSVAADDKLRQALGGKVTTRATERMGTGMLQDVTVLVPLVNAGERSVRAVLAVRQRPESLNAAIAQAELANAGTQLLWLALVYSACYAIVRSASQRLREANRRLTELATVDSLTGALNRRALEERCDAEIGRAQRAGRPLALLMVDVDNMKEFNDTYGHVAGDAILHTVGLALRRNCRSSDAVGRYGGDEFCAILAEADEEGAAEVAARMQEAIGRRPFAAPDGTWVPITLSIGIAVYPHDGSQAGELYAAADKAMYRSKTSGGGLVRLASATPAPSPR